MPGFNFYSFKKNKKNRLAQKILESQILKLVIYIIFLFFIYINVTKCKEIEL